MKFTLGLNVCYEADPGDTPAPDFFDEVMAELVVLDGISDASLDLNTLDRVAHFALYTTGTDPEEVLANMRAALRCAIHAAGGATPADSWEDFPDPTWLQWGGISIDPRPADELQPA